MGLAAKRTPTLAEVIREAVDAGARALRVAMPGVVKSYDPLTQLADVQPALKETPPGESAEDLPIITQVQVMHPNCRMGNAGGYAMIHLPVTAGTTGLLIFCDRSIDAWMNNPVPPGTATVDPLDVRAHNLTDAVFIPGVNPLVRALVPPIIPIYDNDIRVALYYPEQGINSQFWLGGDTGDIVAVPSPQGKVRLGGLTAPTYSATTPFLLATFAQAMLEIMGTMICIPAAPPTVGPWPAPPLVPIFPAGTPVTALVVDPLKTSIIEFIKLNYGSLRVEGV